jgi:quercetin dioxygenase-like cupin family protein
MDSAYRFIANLSSEMPDAPPDSIVSRTLVNDDRVSVTLFGFAAGQELSEHTSSYPAVLHFLQGEAELTLGGDRLEARTGAWAYLPPRLRHSIRATAPTVMLLALSKSVSASEG